MKKIDLHIHTLTTASDSDFEFSLEAFKSYVTAAELAALAVTNHNVFDRGQFEQISDALDIPVYPGIEIDLCKCHLLLISDLTRLDEFTAAASKVSAAIPDATASITVKQLIDFFGDLHDYLLIPHYEKKPKIAPETLVSLSEYVSAGEVDSAKKFIRATRDDSQLVPVLFSDTRISTSLARYPSRQTFINCGDPSFSAIKTCLADRTKVALTEHDGNKLFPALPDGELISTGLNVLLGQRSSGKSYTLDEIYESNESVKYIRQFDLVQQDEAADERSFKKDVERRRRNSADDFLQGFKNVVDHITEVDRSDNHDRVDDYVQTLIASAEECDRNDSFSNTELFNETAFSMPSDSPLKDLIGSVRQLIENIDHRDTIEKHVQPDALKRLACELIEKLRASTLLKRRKSIVNDLVNDIKESLKVRSAAIQVEDVDLYDVALDDRKIERFDAIVTGLRKPQEISRQSFPDFAVVTEKGPFRGAGELKKANGNKGAFSTSYTSYSRPYEYLQALKENESVSPADFYKLFANVSFRILNKHGFDVSGGERSEFRLLREISDAQNYDILLIDEPESSFDNLFLNDSVNSLLKDISRSMPVVIVTHSSTVGASVGADYLLYTEKTVDGRDVSYKLYRGYPTDDQLTADDGSSVCTYDLLMNSLEAGESVYEERRLSYAVAKN
jgi:Fe-S cluster assembly ATPase SufC